MGKGSRKTATANGAVAAAVPTRAAQSAPQQVTESCGKVQERWCVRGDGSEPGAAELIEARLGGALTSNFVARLQRGFESTFLPEGFPHSVTEDYAVYQLYDTLQALCSSITGTLSTRAVLKGVGVGDSAATALGGTLQWLLQDATGMIGRILFATVVASDLDHDAKRWRLAADITNDVGLCLSILSEHAPREFFLPLTCTASIFWAITGCAGGATRASLTQHFAKRHNTADVAAKDGSQETAVGLIGMLLGMGVAYAVPVTFSATASIVALFVGLHLLANYYAVSSLLLEHINEHRLVLALQRYAATNGASVPTPREMRALEGVILPGPRITRVRLGVSLRAALGDRSGDPACVARAMRQLAERRFAVVADVEGATGSYSVALSERAGPQELLLAYLQCISDSGLLPFAGRAGPTPIDPDAFRAALTAAGWKTDRYQLRVHDWRVHVPHAASGAAGAAKAKRA